MNPMIVVFLILVGIGAAYFFMISLGDTQYAAGNAPNASLTNYGALAAKIVMAVLVIYGIYYIMDAFKTASRERIARQRRAEERERVRRG